MRQAEAKQGMQVTVIGDNPEPQIYDIAELNGRSAKLTYKMMSGKIANGGWMDISMLVEAKKTPA